MDRSAENKWFNTIADYARDLKGHYPACLDTMKYLNDGLATHQIPLHSKGIYRNQLIPSPEFRGWSYEQE